MFSQELLEGGGGSEPKDDEEEKPAEQPKKLGFAARFKGIGGPKAAI